MVFGASRSPAASRRLLLLAGVCLALVLPVYLAEIASAFGLSIGVDSGLPFWSIGEASPATRAQVEAVAADAGVVIDSRRHIDVLADMRTGGRHVVPAVQIAQLLSPSANPIDVDRLLPLGGISSSHTLLCNQSGQYVTYDSDEHGFRNPRGLWNLRRLDIAVVGQSFAQGYCVPDGATFADLLRAEYPATLNLGMSGEAPLLQLGAIKEYLSSRSPRTVLWVFQEGIDLGDLREQMQWRIPKQYLDRGFTQRLSARQMEIDAALSRFVAQREAAERSSETVPQETSVTEQALAILKLWRLRGWLNVAYDVEGARTVSWLRESNNQPFSDILRQARDITGGWGGRLYLVYLPSWGRYRHNAQAVELQRTAVMQIAQSLGIAFIDVHSAFAEQSDPLSLFPFRRFGHYNENGNKVVASAILKVLRKDLPES